MIAGSTTIRLLADITDVQRKMADLQGRVGGLAGRIKGAFSGVAGMLAGAFSVGAIAAWVHKSIQAIDRLAELSAITGMTAAQVSGLQLAFQLGGMQADRMGPALARLSTAISTGSKELQAMGVATKNADGSLRSTRDVLGDVADAFAGYEDGAGKAAIAVRLFGESGTQMIPLLNAGAAGLAEFDAMAHRLGLTMDEQTIRHAEQFSDTVDLLGQGVQGVGRQIAAQMLPTLAALGDQFLTAMTSGDRLRQIAQTLGNVLRGLYVVALGVGAVFRTLGTYLGGAAAIIVSIARGDFAAAADISRQLRADLVGGLKNTLAEMDKAWNASGSVAVESITATTRAMRRQAPTIAAITEATRAQTAARDEGLRAEIQAAEIANKQWDEDFKRQEDARLAIEARIRAAREMHEGLQTEARLLQMSGVEREIATAMMELERKGVVRGTEAYEAFADAIRGAIVSRDEQRRASEHAQANAELRRAELEAWQDHWQQIGDGFVDALMDGGRSVADYLRDLFRRLVLRPIVQAIVMPITAAFAGTMGMSGAASAQGLGGVQALSGIRSIYDTIVGGFTRLGDSVAFAANDIGQWLVSNTTGALNQFGGSLMGNASSLGTIGSYLGGAGVGLGLGNLISGQFAAFGNAQVSNIGGTAIGALLGGPLGAAIGGAIGGLINRAFGRGPVQTTGTGITGTFGTGGADVQAYQDWTQRGGWFRRSRGGRNMNAITPELDRFLDDALTQITDATRAHARILGLNADAINGITQQINISLMGLSAEQQQERIAQALARFADHLASVYGVTVREGETASQALSRLATSLATVNAVFDTLEHTLLAVSLAGGDAASKLLDAFGGAEAFVQATSAFYEAFYTEAERTATATRQLTETLAGMGMTLPATRDAYRALVEAQDLNTEAGRQAYVTLLRLAPAFAEVARVGEAAAAAAEAEAAATRQRMEAEAAAVLQNAEASTNAAFAALQSAVEQSARAAEQALQTVFDAQRATIQSQIDAARSARDVASESVRALRGLFDFIKGHVQSLLDDGGAGMTGDQGRAFIARAIGTARTTGYMPDQAELEQAIGAVRATLDEGNFQTAFDQRRATLALAAELLALQEIAGTQMSVAERQLAAAERQIVQLEASLAQALLHHEAMLAQSRAEHEQIIANAQAQINALNGINGAVMSVADAMRAFGSAVASQQAAQAAARQPAQQAAGGGGYRLIGDTLHFPGGGTHQVSSPGGAQLLMKTYGLIPGPGGTMIRTRSKGGYTPPGMTLVGEEGPELVNFRSPSMVYTAAQTSGLMDGGSTDEMRQLRAEAQAQSRAIVQMQSRMARILERWDGNGMPEQRVVTA